jgi:hypothetical protein
MDVREIHPLREVLPQKTVRILIGTTLPRLRALALRHLSTADGNEKSGVLARAWPIGSKALWFAVLLTAYVLVYYFQDKFCDKNQQEDLKPTGSASGRQSIPGNPTSHMPRIIGVR